MKKNYVKPEFEAVELESESLMNILTGSQSNAGTGSGYVGDETPDCAGGRRGVWGDRWE